MTCTARKVIVAGEGVQSVRWDDAFRDRVLAVQGDPEAAHCSVGTPPSRDGEGRGTAGAAARECCPAPPVGRAGPLRTCRPVLVRRPVRADTVPAEYFIRAGHAACWYSWRMLPRWSWRRMSRRLNLSGSLIGVGSGCSGRALAMPWWGRWALWNCPYLCWACRRWCWFQIKVRSRSSRLRVCTHRSMSGVHSRHLDAAENDCDRCRHP